MAALLLSISVKSLISNQLLVIGDMIQFNVIFDLSIRKLSNGY